MEYSLAYALHNGDVNLMQLQGSGEALGFIVIALIIHFGITYQRRKDGRG